MRIFVDTNVIISAILFPQGKVASVFSYIIESHDLIISSYTIKECETVFDRKFPTKRSFLDSFFNDINYELFETPKKINPKKYPDIRDVNDLPILVSAILSDADILITGDKDFEDIKIEKPLIFTPNQYFELIKKRGN
jgi:putative PIN family toxin of toxin-antitoxin system